MTTPRQKTITLTVSAETHAKWTQAAKLCCLPLSKWVRVCGIDAIAERTINPIRLQDRMPVVTAATAQAGNTASRQLMDSAAQPSVPAPDNRCIQCIERLRATPTRRLRGKPRTIADVLADMVPPRQKPPLSATERFAKLARRSARSRSKP